MRDKNEECNCGVAARSRDTTEPCPAHAKQTYGQYLASFITGPEPVATHAENCNLVARLKDGSYVSTLTSGAMAWCQTHHCWHKDCDPVPSPSEPVAPPAGEGGIMAPQGSGSAGRPEPFQPSPAIATGTIATLRDEIGALRTTLDNMTEEYHHLRAEKASLIATVNDMATMVNEARAEKAKDHAEILAARFDANALRAKLERAREALREISECDFDTDSNAKVDPEISVANVLETASITLEEISPFPEA